MINTMPNHLVFPETQPATEEQFHQLIRWVKSAYGQNFPLHTLMRVMLDVAYNESLPSFFKDRVNVRVTHIEQLFEEEEENTFYHAVKLEADIPVHGERGETTLVSFSIKERETNPTVGTLQHMEEVMTLATSILINGRLSTIEELDRYAELTGYTYEEE